MSGHYCFFGSWYNAANFASTDAGAFVDAIATLALS